MEKVYIYALSVGAFIALLAFLYGVLRLMSANRVLTDTALYGSRALIVDAQGNGDYTTIQAAINAAQAQTRPAIPAGWYWLRLESTRRVSRSMITSTSPAMPMDTHLI